MDEIQEVAFKMAEQLLLLDLAADLMGICNDKDVARVVYNHRYAFRDALNDWNHKLLQLNLDEMHKEHDQEAKI